MKSSVATALLGLCGYSLHCQTVDGARIAANNQHQQQQQQQLRRGNKKSVTFLTNQQHQPRRLNTNELAISEIREEIKHDFAVSATADIKATEAPKDDKIAKLKLELDHDFGGKVMMAATTAPFTAAPQHQYQQLHQYNKMAFNPFADEGVYEQMMYEEQHSGGKQQQQTQPVFIASGKKDNKKSSKGNKSGVKFVYTEKIISIFSDVPSYVPTAEMSSSSPSTTPVPTANATTVTTFEPTSLMNTMMLKSISIPHAKISKKDQKKQGQNYYYVKKVTTGPTMEPTMEPAMRPTNETSGLMLNETSFNFTDYNMTLETNMTETEKNSSETVDDFIPIYYNKGYYKMVSKKGKSSKHKLYKKDYTMAPASYGKGKGALSLVEGEATYITMYNDTMVPVASGKGKGYVVVGTDDDSTMAPIPVIYGKGKGYSGVEDIVMAAVTENLGKGMSYDDDNTMASVTKGKGKGMTYDDGSTVMPVNSRKGKGVTYADDSTMVPVIYGKGKGTTYSDDSTMVPVTQGKGKGMSFYDDDATMVPVLNGKGKGVSYYDDGSNSGTMMSSQVAKGKGKGSAEPMLIPPSPKSKKGKTKGEKKLPTNEPIIMKKHFYAPTPIGNLFHLFAPVSAVHYVNTTVNSTDSESDDGSFNATLPTVATSPPSSLVNSGTGKFYKGTLPPKESKESKGRDYTLPGLDHMDENSIDAMSKNAGDTETAAVQTDYAATDAYAAGLSKSTDAYSGTYSQSNSTGDNLGADDTVGTAVPQTASTILGMYIVFFS